MEEPPARCVVGQDFGTQFSGFDYADVVTREDDERCSNSSSVTLEPIRDIERERIDDDDLITKLVPFIRQQCQDALLPLVSALRSREENEQKHREQMLALEVEKLALEREKLNLKRRRVALCQPAPPRTRPPGHKKRHALRVSNRAL